MYFRVQEVYPPLSPQKQAEVIAALYYVALELEIAQL